MYAIVPVLLAALVTAAVLCGYTTLRLPVRPRAEELRIACVGDSVTYGCTLPLFFLRRWPALLRRALGDGVQVAVFAVNDRSLQDTGNRPFRRERAFRQSLAFRPDIVIILLGTNDSKACNWISAEAFRGQYAEMIQAYRALRPAPRILICTPPAGFPPCAPLFSLSNDADLRCIPEIASAVEEVAAEAGVEPIDLYALTAGRRELFGPDGLHPNAAGARAIAGEIRSAIGDLAPGRAAP